MKNKYTVVTAIEHDNKPYAPGKTIELDDDAAEPLLAVGAIAPMTTPVVTQPQTGPTGAAERIEQIKAAIASLDKNDKAIWTKDGRPNLDALEEHLGWRPAAAERDQACIEMQPDASTE